MTHFRMACYIYVSIIGLTLAACAQSARQNRYASSPAAGAAGTRARPARRRRTARRSGRNRADSLSQLQQGKPPVTPATSPLKDVFFDFDRYDLSGDGRTILRANAEWLKSNPAARVEIEGHCDDRGTNEYNLALGAKRAQSAREYLTTLGIAPARLSTISYGEEIPVCKEQGESCWKQNRRARFVIIQGRPAS